MTGTVCLPRKPYSWTIASAHRYFSMLAGINTVPACPKCDETTTYELREERFRCSHCGYTFHQFSMRWINRGNIPLEYWTSLLTAFITGTSVTQTANNLQLTYQTVYKAFTTIRLAILSQKHDLATHLLDPNNTPIKFCPNIDDENNSVCLQCRSPIFGLVEQDSDISMQMITGRMARDVFDLPVALKTWRTMVYSDSVSPWDTLLFCCCKNAKRLFSSKFTTNQLHFDHGRFKHFADNWLSRYHCISPETSYLYITEIAFRFNIKEQEQFPIIAKSLVSLVPKRRD